MHSQDIQFLQCIQSSMITQATFFFFHGISLCLRCIPYALPTHSMTFIDDSLKAKWLSLSPLLHQFSNTSISKIPFDRTTPWVLS